MKQKFDFDELFSKGLTVADVQEAYNQYIVKKQQEKTKEEQLEKAKKALINTTRKYLELLSEDNRGYLYSDEEVKGIIDEIATSTPDSFKNAYNKIMSYTSFRF